MRSLLVVLLLPLSAHAASVLLVPEDDKARAVAADMVEPLSANKLVVKTAPPGSPAVNCLSKPDERVGCLVAIGEKAKAIAVLVVTGGLKGTKGNVSIELIANGDVVKKVSANISKGKVKQQVKGPLSTLLKLMPKGDASAPVEQAKVTVSEKEPDQPAKDPEPVVKKDPEPLADNPYDAPKKEPTLTPEPKKDPEIDLRTPTPTAKKPKVAAWVVTGLTIAAAGTAATFGGLGASNKGKLDAINSDGSSSLTYTEAQALQTTANTQFTVALGAGIGAGVGAVVSGILWGVE
ncbi:MAG: hypothetical protein QM817_33045 [Archangium sp.]